jgi:hypothetical protein
MEYSGRALPGRNGKTQKKRKLEEKAVGVSSKRLRREKEKRLKRGRAWGEALGRREFGGGPWRDGRKD